jgi:hypothetical protein
MERPLRILLFASDPLDGRKLNIAGEVKAIESAINESPSGEFMNLKVVWNTSPEDILYGICKYHPNVIHYSGRGTSRGLILHGRNNKSMILELKKFAKVLSMVKDEVELLFMNSCFSSIKSKMLLNEINQLVCMEGYADDKAAALFPGFFYRYLGLGFTAEKSLELAKTELLLRNINTGYNPLYFSKQGNETEDQKIKQKF